MGHGWRTRGESGPRLMRCPDAVRALTMAVCLAGAASAAAAPWRVLEDNGVDARARIDNAEGDHLDVYRSEDGRVIAELVIAGPSNFTHTTCPTLQIDDQQPLFSFTDPQACSIEAMTARFKLARITAQRMESALLYQLMNGNQVALRYPTEDRTYRETVFPLERSKKALLRVLGRDLDVQPGNGE